MSKKLYQKPNQKVSEPKQTFINKQLNELITAQREIVDNNSQKIFYLGEAYNMSVIKREIHKKGSITEEEYDAFLSTFINYTPVGEFLEPLLKELYSKFAQEDIAKLHKEKGNTNIKKEDEDK